MERDHYSSSVYASPETARTFDDRRFGGPIGTLVAEDQARALKRFIATLAEAPPSGARSGRRLRVLDVGTGTGRAALLLAREGAEVTGVDRSSQMLGVARQRAAAEGVGVQFVEGDAQALAFPDRSFDVVVSFRVVMHTPLWRRSIAELCRVSNRLVVLDYPAALSLAALQSVGRRLAYAAGAATEPYRVFRTRAIAAALATEGFALRSIHRQFVLPIALHKAVGSRRLTEAVEHALARTGLLKIAGSPVTIVAERCARS
jgi:2-polyprenyl-3-methyl-5-hydroxy-6-metoxy-1,4-benzoquinol methylase